MKTVLNYPQAFHTNGGPERKYAPAEKAKPGDRVLPPDPTPIADRCPKAILDTSPEEDGLGVWLLVEKQEEDGEVYCVYKYGGGIV